MRVLDCVCVSSMTILNILILKYDSDIIKLFAEKNYFFILRLSIRKTATTLNKIALEVLLKDREIERLREELI